MTVERRQWVFGGLAVLALGAMVWVLMRPADGTGASGAAVTPQTRARSAAREQPPVGPPAPVQLSALEAGREQPVESPRNPFRFQPKVAPAPPGPAAPPPGNLPPAVTAPAGPPQVPPIALKFIGVVEKADGLKLAVLTDGKVTLYGREGDIIDGRYRVLKIGVESIEVAYADGRGRQTIRLTGQ